MWFLPFEPSHQVTVGLEVFWPARGELRPHGGVLLGYRRLLREDGLRQVGGGGTVELDVVRRRARLGVRRGA